MTPTDIEKLKELAAAATPGPWQAIATPFSEGFTIKVQPHGALRGFTKTIAFVGDRSDEQTEATARLIAAANPSAVLSLIAALEAAQGENQELRAADRDHAAARAGMESRLNAALSAKDAEIERLKEYIEEVGGNVERALKEKDAEIEAAEAALKEAREGLKPFARAAEFYAVSSQTDEETQMLVHAGEGLSGALKVKDFRKARALLSKQGE
jgi:hypothetical protein